MSEIVNVETLHSSSTFRSSGGYETAVRDFLKKFPSNSAGTVTIRREQRDWYRNGDIIVISKPVDITEPPTYD